MTRSSGKGSRTGKSSAVEGIQRHLPSAHDRLLLPRARHLVAEHDDLVVRRHGLHLDPEGLHHLLDPPRIEGDVLLRRLHGAEAVRLREVQLHLGAVQAEGHVDGALQLHPLELALEVLVHARGLLHHDVIRGCFQHAGGKGVVVVLQVEEDADLLPGGESFQLPLQRATSPGGPRSTPENRQGNSLRLPCRSQGTLSSTRDLNTNSFSIRPTSVPIGLTPPGASGIRGERTSPSASPA